MRKKLSIVLGLAIFFIIVPLVNAQVGDQNGIPPTDAIAGFIVNGTTWFGDSYNTTVELIGGEGIGITQNATDGAIMINSTDYPAVGQVDYFSVTHPGHPIVIAAQSNGTTNLVEMDPPSHVHSETALRFDNGGSDNGRLRYIGEQTMNFVIEASVTFDLIGSNNDVIVLFGINGVPLDHAQTMRSLGSSGDIGSMALHTISELKQNDYVSLFLGNLDSGNDLEVHSISMIAQGESGLDPDATQYGFLDSIHAIGNVTNTGCIEGEILKVDSGGTFVCAADGGGGGSGEINTASNLSPGEGIFAQKNLLDLEFKSLVGEGIDISSNSTSVILNVTGGGSGEVNTASNLNEGYGLFASKVGDDLQFKSLLNGSGISITQNSTNIMINSTSTRDQVYWLNVPLAYDEAALFLGLDGEAYDIPSGSSLDYQAIMTKPLYLDYIEFQITANTIPTGDYRFRVIDNGLPITGDFILDIGSASTGDTFRYELDVQVNAGDQIFIDSECTSGVACTSGIAWYVATMEYYAVDDANYYDGWTFQDDNLGNHTATQALDMDNNSIQDSAWYETDGTVSSQGALRMSFGEDVAWRNSLGTDDIYIETLGLDNLAIQINTEQVAVFSTSDLDLKDNNLEIGSGRIGFDDFDTAIQQSTSDLELRTGGAIVIDIGGGHEYDFSSTAADFNDNSLKGSLGCSDGEAITYQSSGDVWICGTAGGGNYQTMMWNGDPTLTVVKGATPVYIGFGSASSVTEGDVRMPMGEAGTASRLECEVSTSGTNANTQVMVRKAGNTALTVNYGAGVSGIQQDFVNSFTFNQQDRIDIRIINNSGGGGAASIVFQHCSFLVTYD